jgi:predicted dehydrogenase
MFSDFVDRVLGTNLDPAPLDEALYVARVIERAYASSKTGRALPLWPEDAAVRTGEVR